MANLTKREVEVLRLMIIGFSNREISNQLFITSHTVKSHLSSVYYKLNTKNRIQTAIKAISQGIVKIEDFEYKEEKG